MTNSDLSRMIRLSAAGSTVERITGDRPSPSTLHRWAQRGLAGVRLRTTYALGTRRVTEQWLREFFDAVAAAKGGDAAPPVPPTTASKSIKEAEDRLAASGI